MTQATSPIADCFGAHEVLVKRALLLSQQLQRSRTTDADLLRLGATCVNFGARRALLARDLREAIVGWSECELGDRQIRSATYQALRTGGIESDDYDDTFGAAIAATRIRRDELLRLRRELRTLAVI